MASVFASATAPEPVTNMTVYDWLRRQDYDVEVQKIRVMMRANPEKAKALKKQLPAITISGRFSHRANSALIQHTGLICVDIDGKDNPEYTVRELKEICTIAPWIAYAGESVSGKGVFAVTPLLHPAKHLEHFRAIQRDFEEFGIVIDSACSEVSRLRFYSWDAKPYWNHFAENYTRLIEPDRSPIQIQRRDGQDTTETAVSRIVEEIQRMRVDITGGNKDWYNLGCSLAAEFGERGREFFHAVSQFYQNERHRYSAQETDKMFSRCLRFCSRYSISTFFYRAKEFGVMAKKTA